MRHGESNALALAENPNAVYPAQTRVAPSVSVVNGGLFTDEVSFRSTVDVARGVSLLPMDSRTVASLQPVLVDEETGLYRADVPHLPAGAHVPRVGKAGALVVRQ